MYLRCGWEGVNLQVEHIQVEASCIVAHEGDAFGGIDGPGAEVTGFDTHVENRLAPSGAL